MSNTTTSSRSSRMSGSSSLRSTSSIFYDESIIADATASSLVSETILDSPSLGGRQERRAALRQKAKTIINKGVIAAVNEDRKGNGTPNSSVSGEQIHVHDEDHAHSVGWRDFDSQSLPQTRRHGDLSGSEYGEDNQDIYAHRTGFTPGILESGKQWFQAQKVKWQKQALEEKVEAQRRILLEKTIRRNKFKASRRGSWTTSRSAPSSLGFSTNEDHNRSLGDNETYRSITQKYKEGGSGDDQGEGMGMGLCGGVLVDDEDEDYIMEEGTKQEGEGHSDNTHDKSSALDASTDANVSLNTSGDDEASFFIGTPHGTYTGGIAVQLELIEGTKKKKKNLIKVEEEPGCNIPFLLTLEQMTSLTEIGLPPSIAFSKWKRLYCLQRDGDSFSGSFLKKVESHEKTLLVVQTTNHEIFGAYTNSPWEGQGNSGTVNFYGSAQACLFSIDKDRLERDDENYGVLVYKWTGKNRYIQVCDLQHKMIALGGGGRDGEFGMCVEDDFRVGSTGPCDTFDNAPLCKQGQFEIMNVECYGFVTGF